jgi:branched-subunit amino acid transport protein AzlD
MIIILLRGLYMNINLKKLSSILKMKQFIKYIGMIISFSIITTLVNVVLTGDVTSLHSFVFGLIFWMILSILGWTIVFIFLYFEMDEN